jgi:hypothetical protein
LLPSAFEGALPASVLPVCQFAAKMRAPNRLKVFFGHVDFGPAMTLPDREVIPEGDLALIEDLALIQARTSTPFPIPDDLRRQDLWMVHRIARLLEGERITLGQEPVEPTLTVTSPDVFTGLLAFQDGTTLAYMIDSTVEIAGITVPLGPATIYVPSATLDGRERLQALGDVPVGTALKLRFLPIDDAPVQMMLGHLLEESEQPTLISPAG